MGRKSASGSGSHFLELRNHFFGFFGVKIIKLFDADPGSGMETVRIRDGDSSDPGSGMEKVGSGIRDKHPGSATLLKNCHGLFTLFVQFVIVLWRGFIFVKIFAWNVNKSARRLYVYAPKVE